MSDVIGSIFKRILLAAVCLVVLAVFLVAAAIGGGGSATIWMTSFAVLFLGAWIVLPAIRASRVFAAVFCVLWIALTIPLSQKGFDDARGWMLQPWALATFAIIFCLVAKRPSYIGPPAADPDAEDLQ